MKDLTPFIFLILSILIFQGCTTEIDINADETDIWVVYGVLDQTAEEQYIRISKGFLPEGDALDYAKENDLTVKGLNVTLVSGNKTYTAVPIDSIVKDEGIFNSASSLYKFETSGNNDLNTDQTYELRITNPDDPEFLITGSTSIPEKVVINNPRPTPGPGQSKCLREVTLDGEYKMDFQRGNGFGFEIRASLEYEENFETKVVHYGPTNVFSENNRCNTTVSGDICYQFREKEILSTFFNLMNIQSGNIYTYGVNNNTKCQNNEASLPRVFKFEVTAMDEVVANYLQANSPQFSDLSTVRPEYSNLTGSTSSGTVIGIFGSYTKTEAIGRLNPCSEYLLNLNDVSRPSSPCAF